MNRKSFVLYTEWENTFDRLSNEVAGELIKVIFDYVRTGEVPQIDNAVVDGVFSVFQPSIDRNISKYDAAIEQRKEAGKRSAEKRKRDATTVDESKRDATTVESRSRSSTDSVSDSVSDSVELVPNSEKENLSLDEIDKRNAVSFNHPVSEEFLKFNNWLKENCPFVLKVKTQISEKDYNRLRAKYSKSELCDALESLNNWKDFPKKRTSVPRSTLDELKKKFGERI